MLLVPLGWVMGLFTAGTRFLVSSQEWLLLRALRQFLVIDVSAELDACKCLVAIA